MVTNKDQQKKPHKDATKDTHSARVGATGPARGGAAVQPSSKRSGHARLSDAAPPSTASDVAAFVQHLTSLAPVGGKGRGRLVFAMDATMSRQPTWDIALAVQSEMFEAVRDVGGLDVQLVYFRGAGQCRASKWVSNPDGLQRLMTSVSCQGGTTQIGKVLHHVLSEAEAGHVNAVVYVGDAMEEDVDALCGRAGELALVGVPVFVFQEGSNAQAELAFREIARLTKGCWSRFDSGSAAQLRQLLQAVAVYAAGGRKALLELGQRGTNAAAQRLIADMTQGR